MSLTVPRWGDELSQAGRSTVQTSRTITQAGREIGMGRIAVHEFISLDGVFEDPRWTMAYPFDPKMGEAIGAIMGASEGLLLGRRT